MTNVIAEHITKTPGVCGGKACVAGTRVRVMDILIWHEHLGWSADEIVSQIPAVTLSDVHAALAYYFDNREEIEEDIRRNDEIAEKFRAQYPSKLKEKLSYQGISHAGIAYAKSGTRSISQLIQKLKLIHDVLTSAEMENHIEYL